MAVAKRHHTVPQFYLRGFADGGRIATVLLPGERRFVQSVRKAASENNFYALDGHQDGPDVFEKLLSSVEGEAARVLESVMRGAWPLRPEDRITLASFLALQAVRGPEQRRNMEYVAAQMTRLEIGYGGRVGVKGWFKRNRGVSVTDEQAEALWQQATRPGGPPISMAPAAHVQQIVDFSQHLLPYFLGRPWILVRFEKRTLITCDVPIGLVPRPEDAPESGVGFMTAWGMTFPLSRKVGLLMSDPMIIADVVSMADVSAGKFDHAQRGTTQLQKFFNEMTVRSASEWLYHHPDDKSSVPCDLPGPQPETMYTPGGPDAFSGEPSLGC